MPWRAAADPEAWTDLDDTEERDVWDLIYLRFKFQPTMEPSGWPSFSEPVGSATWDCSSVYKDYERAEGEVAGHLRECLLKVGGDDGFVYALDWQHPGYRFRPEAAHTPTRIDSWLVPCIPNGDYYLFLSPDFRYGWLSHPWEQSVCVFGELLTAITPALDAQNWPVLREDGRAA